jgi:hypothetical protein
MTINYPCDSRLFDQALQFPYLLEANLLSSQVSEEDVGDYQFDDALRLLGLPRLQKLSLTCASVRRSSVRSVAPRSSTIRHLDICCPNIPAVDFDYLMSLPRALETFSWKGKAWTCHGPADDVDMEAQVPEGEFHTDGDESSIGRNADAGDDDEHDDDVTSDSLVEAECLTISLTSTIMSLRRTQAHLKEMTIEYAFVGTCPHTTCRSADLRDFRQLSRQRISPQVLRGFHRCSRADACSQACHHLRNSSEAADLLPAGIQRLDLGLQTNGEELADMISGVVATHAATLRHIMLRSSAHFDHVVRVESDSARRPMPKSKRRYDEI